jgi:hypothetical protein
MHISVLDNKNFSASDVFLCIARLLKVLWGFIIQELFLDVKTVVSSFFLILIFLIEIFTTCSYIKRYKFLAVIYN